MRDNVCIFQSVVHDKSGSELDPGYLIEGTYIESIELDGPKLFLVYADGHNYLKNTLQVTELDEFTVEFGAPWRAGGVSKEETFVVLTVGAQENGHVRIEMMAKPVYKLKILSEQPKFFNFLGMASILATFCSTNYDISVFPIITNFQHLINQRPSAFLREIAEESGSLIWYARGTLHMRKFAELFAKGTELEFHWGRIRDENRILKYSRPSRQVSAQEKAAHVFTGWSEVLGRVKASLDTPFLQAASSKPAKITSTPLALILGNQTVAHMTAIDFVAMGNMSLTAGQPIKLYWHTPDPANPFNEGLPDKVVVESVSHWYSSQKFYSRVKGAVAVEPI